MGNYDQPAIDGNKYGFGTSVGVSCNVDNYFQDGSDTNRECQADGTWSNANPNCISKSRLIIS